MSLVPSEDFQYDQLSTNDREIRLLRIPRTVPDRRPENVDYTLLHVPLDTPTAYRALSYTWGNPDPPNKISVDGRQFLVTANLAAALENLQRDDQETFFWIDAISINQKDPIEKSVQVQLMRHIYKSASEVIIWLGPSTPQTNCTMQEIRKLGNTLLEAGVWDLKPEDTVSWDTLEDRPEAAVAKRKTLSLIDEHLALERDDKYPFWWVMSDVSQRAWFHRVWCIQECTNARIATVRCGQEDVDFKQYWAVTFYIYIFICQALSHVRENYEEGSHLIWLVGMLDNAFPTQIIKMRRTYLVKHGYSLKELLYEANVIDSSSPRRIEATDPRDRVFALLGIANDDAAKDIVPDYTLSCKEAYTRTARVLLEHGHDDILSLCRNRSTCPDLPSWVPDWTALNLKPWSVCYDNSKFNACGNGHVPTVSTEADRQPNEIILNGVLAGTITRCGTKVPNTGSDNVDYALVGPLFQDIEEYLLSCNRYSPEQQQEAKWRIPIGDTELNEATNTMGRLKDRKSFMKTGYEVTCRILDGTATPDYISVNTQPHAAYLCQMLRMHNCRAMLTEENYVGISAMETEIGDSLALFMGAQSPYIIRRVEGTDAWTLIGEAHVFGMMDGEYMEKEKRTIQEIKLR